MVNLYLNKEECTGCSACFNICPVSAITMKPDSDGFLYPEINSDKCINCNKCNNICKTINNTPTLNFKQEFFGCKSKNKSNLLSSSSGGMFTELSDYVLSLNGIIYGCAYDDNFNLKHIRCDNKISRNLCKGAKYSQSNINTTFKSILNDLNNDLYVLFSGTPCQTAGLNAFLKSCNINTEKLLTVDIICHGTPSNKLFKEFISFVEKTRKLKIKSFYHRPKDLGWTNIAKIEYFNGKEEMFSPLSEAWKCIFLSDLALRQSCYTCNFAAKERHSDITIGDFWGVDSIDPDFFDSSGVSIISINTIKGKSYFDKIKNSIDFKKYDYENAILNNPNFYKPTEKPLNIGAFWNDYHNKGIKYTIKKYGKYNIKRRIKFKIKKFIKN